MNLSFGNFKKQLSWWKAMAKSNAIEKSELSKK
jgi:hypothetical protein